MKRLFTTLIVFTSLIAACQNTKQTSEIEDINEDSYQFNNEIFSIDFPQSPDFHQMEKHNQIFGKILLNSYNYEEDDCIFTINYYQIPANKISGEKEIKDFYKGAIYGFSYEMGRDIVLVNDTKLNVHSGKLFDLKTTGYEGHILGSIFLINNVVYMTTAISDQEEKAEQLKDFVKSFKLKE